VEQDTFNVISVYATRVGLEEHMKVKFWEDLAGLIQEILLGKYIFLKGGLNGQVRSGTSNFEGLHEGITLER
jgi:hypothetical protein